MDPETVSILCSPDTHEPLTYRQVQTPDGHFTRYLEAVGTGQQFFFKNGIPVFYDVSQLTENNLRFNTFYQKSARYYDLGLKILAGLLGKGETNFRKQYLQLLEFKKNDRVLEVSVGTGTNLSLTPKFVRCYGLDLSWEMLSRCQKNLIRWNRKIELFFGNAEALPFIDHAFDIVFHVGGINAFNDRAKAINEMIRVARPGSKIVIVDETAKLLKKLSWIRPVHTMIEQWGDRFEAPVNLVPSRMQELRVDTLINGYFYVLSFRKPDK
ncbi:MAG: class I SAM-dependent methyltransferase [Brevefilum sp.]|nr:class I SAM-dependent methyltransferase [Brevefilum sp.]